MQTIQILYEKYKAAAEAYASTAISKESFNPDAARIDAQKSEEYSVIAACLEELMHKNSNVVSVQPASKRAIQTLCNNNQHVCENCRFAVTVMEGAADHETCCIFTPSPDTWLV